MRRRLRPLAPAVTALAAPVVVAVVLVGPTASGSTPGSSSTATTPGPVAATPSATPLVVPTQDAPGAATVSAAPLLAPLPSTAALPAPGALAARLTALTGGPGPTPSGPGAALGPSLGYTVVDVATGTALAGRAPTLEREPASTAKLLTGAAALSVLGPDTRLATRVVAGATPDEIVVVAGGDVLLSAGAGAPLRVNGRAGLADLARATAAALRAQGRTTVAVRLDDTVFSGPVVDPRWEADDVQQGFVAPVMGLEVDAGRLRPGGYAQRATDPALAATRRFASLLAASGVTPLGQVARMRAPVGALEIARVTSAPVSEIVEYMLEYSENTVAEALARLLARASARPATFADAGTAVLERLAGLGLKVGRARLAGGSGLAAGSLVSPALLADVLRLAAGPDHPQLRPLLTGLPVAAASGTLAGRFGTGPLRVGAGMVRAKTGTLTGVTSLAGVVVDADGRLLAFAVMADRTGPTPAARRAVDGFAAALAGCGCR